MLLWGKPWNDAVLTTFNIRFIIHVFRDISQWLIKSRPGWHRRTFINSKGLATNPIVLLTLTSSSRYFGTYRNGASNIVPDDIGGLPSTHIRKGLATNPDTLLYSAEIDHGRAFRCLRPGVICFCTPVAIQFLATQGINKCFKFCTCDEICCWLRKEYSTRTFFNVYPNRIEVNNPSCRMLGCFGCGSWNADDVTVHYFDRGAFGFRRVKAGVINHLCCIWPVYGGVVARQRCQCNGSLWDRMCTDCKGWWCDEWLCDICFCSYRYYGIADPDETSIAAGLALQAYFEGRFITKEEFNRCLNFWRENVSEMTDPVGRKRDICCEPCSIPCCDCQECYANYTHPLRTAPSQQGDIRISPEMLEVRTALPCRLVNWHWLSSLSFKCDSDLYKVWKGM